MGTFDRRLAVFLTVPVLFVLVPLVVFHLAMKLCGALGKLTTTPCPYPGFEESFTSRTPPEMGTSTIKGVVSGLDRKSTRLNSSHSQISYAVFCLKKKR